MTSEEFLAQLEDLIPRMVPRPKALIVNFPSNPTTECVDLPFLARLVQLAKEYGFHLIQDLAYADIAFDGYKPPSVLQVPGAKDVAVEFFTLSKSYNMPGWRVGFMVGNPVLVAALARLKSYFDYGTFTPIQVASIHALEGPQECVHQICENYRKRRDVLVEGLNKLGWPVALPKATMFVWAQIPEAFRELGISGVCEANVDRSQDRRLAGDRLRRLRRRPRPLLADRKRRAHPAGAARHQADVRQGSRGQVSRNPGLLTGIWPHSAGVRLGEGHPPGSTRRTASGWGGRACTMYRQEDKLG